jgi:predicted DNA-binding ribbon-helix-helix protein
MKSPVAKRSVVVGGHKTSVSLEEAFWDGLKEISGSRNTTLSGLISEIDSNRHESNLSSTIRLFVLGYFKSRAATGEVVVPQVNSPISTFCLGTLPGSGDMPSC